ncbi:hypothetical protein B7486_00755 [cyanobacterium TDX16]|nr:hypothetical protein B7486_00755 [cyanobacterium TDX16]
MPTGKCAGGGEPFAFLSQASARYRVLSSVLAEFPGLRAGWLDRSGLCGRGQPVQVGGVAYIYTLYEHGNAVNDLSAVLGRTHARRHSSRSQTQRLWAILPRCPN